jgi:hypothetical protein
VGTTNFIPPLFVLSNFGLQSFPALKIQTLYLLLRGVRMDSRLGGKAVQT